MQNRSKTEVVADQHLIGVEYTKQLMVELNSALQGSDTFDAISALHLFALHLDRTLGNKYKAGRQIATKELHSDFSMDDYSQVVFDALSECVQDLKIQNPLDFKALGEAIMEMYGLAADENSTTHKIFPILNRLKNGVQLFEKVVSSRGMIEEYPDDNVVGEWKLALTGFINSSLPLYQDSLAKLTASICLSTDSSIKDAANGVLTAAKQASINHPKKIVEITKALEAATAVVEDPTDMKKVQVLHTVAGHVSERSWGRVLGAAMVGLVGAAIVVGFTALAVASFGVSLPISGLAAIVGTSMLVGGIAVGAAAFTGTTYGLGAAHLLYQGYSKGKLANRMDDLEKLAKKSKRTK